MYIRGTGYSVRGELRQWQGGQAQLLQGVVIFSAVANCGALEQVKWLATWSLTCTR